MEAYIHILQTKDTRSDSIVSYHNIVHIFRDFIRLMKLKFHDNHISQNEHQAFSF